MNMEELKQLISLYVDGEATPEQEDIALSALSSSGELREYYQDLLNLSASLQEWPDETLSPDLEQTIHKHLAKQEEPKMKKSLTHLGATIAIIVMIVLVGQKYSNMTFKSDVGKTTDYAVERIASSQTPAPSQTKTTPYTSKGASSEALVADAVKLSHTPKETPASDKAVRSEGGFKAMGFVMYEQKSGQYQPYYLDQEYSVVKSDETMPLINRSMPAHEDREFNTEQYDYFAENEFVNVTDSPLSTFSIDVDTASYANLRRFLTNGQTPPQDAIRIEEMINYFVYDYPQPTGEDPFSVNVEIGACPWNTRHQLAMIGLQGKSLDANTIPESNLVFLIDVSGSMSNQNKLPLLKQGFKMMVNQLRPEEKVSIVTYAGNAGVVLDSVSGADKQRILSAIDNLQSGGSTAGAQGILTAYELAKKNLIPGGNNRVILATDGDFNIGASSDGELVRIIEEKRQQGIFLTVLGFGMGNYKDGKMEKLADKGNGNYYYIDTEREAKKVMVRELGSTLFTIAKDVKLQIEFNPAQVKAYRLVGYENRKLNKEDFNDDTKDAGELGAGHTVTAFYEIIPADSEEEINKNVDPLKYQVPTAQVAEVNSEEIMTVKLRYKKPDEDVSKLVSRAVNVSEITENSSQNFHWASSVAEFGMILRNSKFKAQSSFQGVLQRAKSAKGTDEFGYRQEFIELVEKAQTLVPETYSTGYGVKGSK